jgi:hypothetical protein
MGKDVAMVKKSSSAATFLRMFSPYITFTCHRILYSGDPSHVTPVE